MTVALDEPTVLAAGGPNAIAVTLGLIGDEWTLLILRHAHTGARRYNEWLERLPISHAVLTARLGRLVEHGLLRRVAYETRPPRHEYRLTKRGRDTWSILLAIWAWEAQWAGEHAERLPQMVHARCGSVFRPVLTCVSCGEVATPRDVRGSFGPSGSWERSVPTATTRRRSGATAVGPGLFPQTMALLGNRWSAALLGAAFLGARRFSEFEQRLAAPPRMVADRLRVFTELGVLTAAPGPSYRLTAKGRAFFPVVVCVLDWGHRWFKAPEGRALVYRHDACAAAFAPRLACGTCGEALRRADVVVRG